MRPKLDQPRVLTAGLTDHRRPAVAPGGALLAHEVLLEGGASELVLTDAEGRFGRALGGPGARRDALFLSPGLLAFCEERAGGRMVVVTFDLASGKRAVKLEHPQASLAAPAIAERRGRLLVTGEVPRGSPEVALELDLAAPSAAAVEKLTERVGQVERRPASSPDGALVAFEAHASASAKDAAIALFDVKRRRTDVLAFEPGVRLGSPRFVDDKRIVFDRRAADGRVELVLCEWSTKRLTPIDAGMPACEPHPFRRKDGTLALAFAGQPSVRGDKEERGARYEIVVAGLGG